jgi:predicted P-loop ATPase
MPIIKNITKRLSFEGPSFFRSEYDKAPAGITWEHLRYLVTEDPVVAQRTLQGEEYLQQGDREGFTRCKRGSGAITPAVTCEEGHSYKHVVAYTGMLPGDFDNLGSTEHARELQQRLSALPYVAFCWLTASRKGLRVGVPFTLSPDATKLLSIEGFPALSESRYKQLWNHVMDKLEEAVGVSCDRKTCDPTRLSYISHDDGAYFNLTATPYPVTEQLLEEPSATRRQSGITKKDPFEVAVKMLEKGEQQNYAEGNRNNYVFRLCAILNRMGVMFGDTLDYCRNNFADLPDNEILSTVRSAYRAGNEFATLTVQTMGNDSRRQATQRTATDREGDRNAKTGKNAKNSYSVSTEEIEAFVRRYYLMRHNIITHHVEWCLKGDDCYHDLRDEDVNSIWRAINIATGRCANINHIWSIVNSDFCERYNPLTTFLLQGTTPWHKGDTDHIARLAATLHSTAPDGLLEWALRKWLVAMVATMLSDKKNQAAFILIGRPGIGKTTWFRRLWPDSEEMKRYYNCTADSDFSNKDMKLAFTEFGLICMDEIDRLMPRDLSNLKSLMTCDSISERAPYERTKMRRERYASLCGTGNTMQFVGDDATSRRMLVFQIDTIDDAVNMEVDHAALFGQAVALYNSGFRYWFTDGDRKRLKDYESKFEIATLEEERIKRFFFRAEKGKNHYKTDPIGSKVMIQPLFLGATEIMARCNEGLRACLNLHATVTALEKLGYKRCKRTGKWGYVVVPRDLNEIHTSEEDEAANELEGVPPEEPEEAA